MTYWVRATGAAHGEPEVGDGATGSWHATTIANAGAINATQSERFVIPP
jgi:hypothetical protein